MLYIYKYVYTYIYIYIHAYKTNLHSKDSKLSLIFLRSIYRFRRSIYVSYENELRRSRF